MPRKSFTKFVKVGQKTVSHRGKRISIKNSLFTGDARNKYVITAQRPANVIGTGKGRFMTFRRRK